jgi:hypothetical protein
MEGDRLQIAADENQRQWPANHFARASPLLKKVGPSGLADKAAFLTHL